MPRGRSVVFSHFSSRHSNTSLLKLLWRPTQILGRAKEAVNQTDTKKLCVSVVEISDAELYRRAGVRMPADVAERESQRQLNEIKGLLWNWFRIGEEVKS